LAITHVPDDEENHTNAGMPGFDALAIDPDLLVPDGGKVMLDQEALEVLPLRKHVLKQLPKSRDVPLAASELEHQATLDLLRGHLKHLAECVIGAPHPAVAVEE